MVIHGLQWPLTHIHITPSSPHLMTLVPPRIQIPSSAHPPPAIPHVPHRIEPSSPRACPASPGPISVFGLLLSSSPLGCSLFVDERRSGYHTCIRTVGWIEWMDGQTRAYGRLFAHLFAHPSSRNTVDTVLVGSSTYTSVLPMLCAPFRRPCHRHTEGCCAALAIRVGPGAA